VEAESNRKSGPPAKIRGSHMQPRMSPSADTVMLHRHGTDLRTEENV
jgi:hypothetical protein